MGEAGGRGGGGLVVYPINALFYKIRLTRHIVGGTYGEGIRGVREASYVRGLGWAEVCWSGAARENVSRMWCGGTAVGPPARIGPACVDRTISYETTGLFLLLFCFAVYDSCAIFLVCCLLQDTLFVFVFLQRFLCECVSTNRIWCEDVRVAEGGDAFTSRDPSTSCGECQGNGRRR